MLEFIDITEDNELVISEHLRIENYNLLHFKDIKDDFKAIYFKDSFIGIISLLFGKKTGIVNELFLCEEYRNSVYFKYVIYYIFGEFQKRNIKFNVFQVDIDDLRSINFHVKRGAKATKYKVNFISYIRDYVNKIEKK
jgi:hypothetical protein